MKAVLEACERMHDARTYLHFSSEGRNIKGVIINLDERIVLAERRTAR